MGTRTKRLAAGALAASLALALPACGGSSNSTGTQPTVIVGPTTVLFEGTLLPGGFSFYSFAVTNEGDAAVMLASVTTSTAPGNEANTVLGLALGTPLGEDCTITSSLPAVAALQSPLVGHFTPGTYCVRVYDLGALKAKVHFAVRIVHT